MRFLGFGSLYSRPGDRPAVLLAQMHVDALYGGRGRNVCGERVLVGLSVLGIGAAVHKGFLFHALVYHKDNGR